jgi:hypothetical protein
MAGEDWVNVGHFDAMMAAAMAAGRLEAAGIPSRIGGSPALSPADCFISVPPDRAEAAKRLLASWAVPQEEPSALARKLLLTCIAGGLMALAGLIIIWRLWAGSHEVAMVRSPDGKFDAILLELDPNSEEGHRYRVCMQTPINSVRVELGNCNEIAYLSGVSSIGGGPPVSLVWTSPSQLEIRYANANSIHIYKPVFVWGSGRYRRLPIFTTAVQTGPQLRDVQGSGH